MNALKNRVQLIGRLGNDPQVRSFKNGNSQASFVLATNDVYYNANKEKVEEVQWHNVVIWGKKAEVAAKYLKKGKEVALEGQLVHRTYTNGKGEKKYVSEVKVSEFVFVDKNKD